VGTFRLVLALMVVASHVGGFGDSPAGGTAVAGFFTISGFLMARTITENYSRSPGRFYLNRVIRIGPPFVVVLLVTALTVWVSNGVGPLSNPVTGGRYMPVEMPASLATLVEWNGRPFPVMSVPQVHLVPQAWSLVVEVIFYAAAPLVVAGLRSRLVAIVMAAALASLGLALLAPPTSDWMRSPATTGWMFLSGALAYRMAGRTGTPSAAADLIGAAAAGVVVFVGLGWAGLSSHAAHLIAPFPTIAWLLLGRWAARESRGLDRLMGNLAYGVFLGHFLGEMLMYWIAEWTLAATGRAGIFGIPDQSDTMLWTFSYVFALAVGVGIYFGIERPFEGLRRAVRRSRLAAAPAVVPPARV
jgi:peptidoglycan/LPS O-acetylase OafA/YrhL